MTKDIGRLQYLEVTKSLQRNSAQIRAAGYENTAQTLIELAQRATGLDSLADVDILDVGCGVRFTMAIINRAIPIRSYSGLEVDQPIIDFLKSKVERHDDRFHPWQPSTNCFTKPGHVRPLARRLRSSANLKTEGEVAANVHEHGIGGSVWAAVVFNSNYLDPCA